jgi:hypothetical protein
VTRAGLTEAGYHSRFETSIQETCFA